MKKEKKHVQISMKDVAPNTEQLSLDENVEADIAALQQNVVSEGQISFFDNTLNQVVDDAIIDKELAKEKLSEVLESEKPKKKKKSLVTNLIFLAINLCVLGYVIYNCIGETDGAPLDALAKQGNKLWWLVGGLILFGIYYLADTLMFRALIKQSTGKSMFKTSYKVSSVGKYFDNITPFSVGGQPSQILNLTRAGVSPGIATSIPIIKLIIYNLVYTSIILLFFIFGIPLIENVNPFTDFFTILLKLVAYIGLAVTAMTSVLFILIGSGKIIGRSLVRKLVKFGYSLRIVKDYRKAYNKFMKTVLEYQSSMAYLKKNKLTLFKCVFWAIIETLAYFAMPFVVVMALNTGTPVATFGEAIHLMLLCMTKFTLCQMASVVIPLPGGTGMMELSFIAMFGVSSLILDNISLGLLIWRFLTYYFTVIQGFIISTADSLSRYIKGKRESKALELQEQNTAVSAPEVTETK